MSKIYPFLKTKLTYRVLEYIAGKRTELLGDLVAYTNDPVRKGRRYRMLAELSTYEISVLNKIQNFDSDDENDFGETALNRFIKEIDSITNTDA